MSPERKLIWVNGFSAMSTIWPFFEPTTFRIRVFEAALADLDDDELERAIAHVVSNHSGHWPPSPGNIRDAARGKLTKCAVTRVDGKIVRWEERRIAPTETPHEPVRALRSLHGEEATAQAALGNGRRARVLPPHGGMGRNP